MVNLTISLPEETTRMLRRAVREYYEGKRGAISGMIDEAIREHLEGLKAIKSSPVFRAMKEQEEVAQAESLADLASMLRKRGIDARDVRIISSSHLMPTARVGLRVHEI
jgi:glutamyl-tRNA reductase